MSDPTLLLTHTVSPSRTAALQPRLEATLPDGAVRNATTPAETRDHLPGADVLLAGRVDALRNRVL